MGVAWALLGHRLAVQGMNAVFASDVPRGAGLSSSASVELAFATAWQAMGRWSLPPMELAVLCQKAENEYVGLRCGIMDQAASACGKQGRVLLLDCRSLELQNLPLPQSAAIIIADSGVRHALSSTGYNDRRAACETAVRILKQKLPAIRALRDVTMDEFDRRSGDLPAEVQKRARHVIQEIGRTQRAVPLLQEGNLPAFGELMDASHASLRDLYEVSCPELDVMVRIAQSLEGCFGARLTGGGFGGCTVNLVAAHQAAGFTEALAHGYEAETRRHSEIYICHASEGAGIL
jgi:galactokinase